MEPWCPKEGPFGRTAGTHGRGSRFRDNDLTSPLDGPVSKFDVETTGSLESLGGRVSSVGPFGRRRRGRRSPDLGVDPPEGLGLV